MNKFWFVRQYNIRTVIVLNLESCVNDGPSNPKKAGYFSLQLFTDPMYAQAKTIFVIELVLNSRHHVSIVDADGLVFEH